MQLLRETFAGEVVLLDLDAHDLETIFQAASRRLVDLGVVDGSKADEVQSALLAREQKASTAIGHAVAVPHAYLEAVTRPTVVFVRLRRPINLGAPDGIPTRFVFFLVGPEAASSGHLDTLAAIARLMADDEFRYEARQAHSGAELVAALDHFRQRTAPQQTLAPQPGAEVPEGLRWTGRPLGGVLGDIARRLPSYAADWRDGLSTKCLASILFLFFACTAPTVIFGGIMAAKTGGQIGVVEMVVATAIGGSLYAVFSGQPLVILGGTGPLLVFIATLYQLCSVWGVDFLQAFAWTGVWTGLFVVILAAADASCLMRYFTRFTDETFSGLISLIFIYEAISSLIAEFVDLEESSRQATALLTLLLALGTFYVAITLTQFRRSSFLLPWMREFLADFGPTIAMALMAWVAFQLDEVDLDRLQAPAEFGSTTGRDWLIDVGAAPLWVKLGAALPAVVGAVLVYLDQNITARLVNSPDHRLQRGPGYHLDLALVGGMIAAMSVFGLPWLVAATVRSLNHVRSLATSETVVSRAGDSRERILHVRENRLTGLAIHLLMGLSLLLLAYVRYVPMAVLYGLFLFMGVVSISGNQFFERLSLWIKDPDLYPLTHYIRRAPLRVVHWFTGVQLACLSMLWLVKTNKDPRVAILFPLLIAMLAPVRWAAGMWFDDEHLAALDADEEPEEEGTHWAG